jgi:hypothetical protein
MNLFKKLFKKSKKDSETGLKKKEKKKTNEMEPVKMFEISHKKPSDFQNCKQLTTYETIETTTKHQVKKKNQK